MESFDLGILFRTEGALVGAALVKALVSAAKPLGLVPDTGRGPLIAAAVLSAGLMALAVWHTAPWVDGFLAADALVIIMAWLGVYTASVGIHETTVKVQRIASGTTNPDGPDQ